MIFGYSLCHIQVFRFDVKCCDIHKRRKRRTSGIGSELSTQRFDCALLGQCMHIVCFFLCSPFSCLWFSLGEMVIDLFFPLSQDHTKRPTFDEIVKEMNETVL